MSNVEIQLDALPSETTRADGAASSPAEVIQVAVPHPHARLRRSTQDASVAEGQARGPGPAQLAAVAIKKSYHKGQNVIPVLRGVDLEVCSGEFVSIIGQSGSGKSTLLHLLGTLDRPDAGQLLLDGRRIDNLTNRRRDLLRNRYFGMIFQFYHLLPELTALGNVLAPLMIGNSTWQYLARRATYRQAAKEMLDRVGLSHRLKHKPRELSGGEMQRTAIARALVNQPQVLLADEPTGNLDRKTGREILEILRTLNQQQKLTIVMVTHDENIAGQADRVVRLVEGRVQEL